MGSGKSWFSANIQTFDDVLNNGENCILEVGPKNASMSHAVLLYKMDKKYFYFKDSAAVDTIGIPITRITRFQQHILHKGQADFKMSFDDIYARFAKHGLYDENITENDLVFHDVGYVLSFSGI